MDVYVIDPISAVQSVMIWCSKIPKPSEEFHIHIPIEWESAWVALVCVCAVRCSNGNGMSWNVTYRKYSSLPYRENWTATRTPCPPFHFYSWWSWERTANRSASLQLVLDSSWVRSARVTFLCPADRTSSSSVENFSNRKENFLEELQAKGGKKQKTTKQQKNKQKTKNK